ncbi:hypothetical protein HG535_0D05440 [Zygotorulaspora mrakii]|uniref:Man1/Src1 C-terminal domain-containing protein n=1 Tax=Zygotorulaspora mrakii TaxID=42260 RepID=A0A7H9B2F1_ZYGMR|nr:uncharacterized protein HG535_0D05440 [Zygotorulaspora mrakii]QLG72835.1 hypothetical protein HG535_0D05440 [Zygotorulaspora mrakii]
MDTEYLGRGFDPNSIKVAQLRRILVENKVDFASHAKKAELVQLFEEQVKPKVPKLRKKYENLLPSDKGIVKVGSKDKSKGKSNRSKLKKKSKARKSKLKVEDGERNEENGSMTPTGEDIQSSKQSSVDATVKSEKESDVEITPFSEVNEMQMGSGRRGSELKTENRDADEHMGEDNDLKIDEDKEESRDVAMESTVSETATPVKDEMTGDNGESKTRKRRRRIGDGENTPITNKVARKSPQKSPHRSLIIDKFESSSSDSSFNNGSKVNISNAGPIITHEESTPEKFVSEGSDFSYRRKTVSPDLSKLKISAAFAEQLKSAVQKTASNTPSRSESEQEYGSRPYSSIRVSRHKASSPVQSDELFAPIAASSEDDETQSSSQETIKSINVEKATSEAATDDIPSARQMPDIQSPKLPTKQDVEDSEARVEKMQDFLNDVIDSPVVEVADARLSTFLKSFCKIFVKFMFFILIAVSISYGLWYRQQRIYVGYCGNETSLSKDAECGPVLTTMDRYLRDYKPQCLPCPDNAICYPKFSIKCKPEYTIQKNPWSLHGLLPLSDRCIKDSKREKLISEVVQKSLEILRAKNAQVSCGECQNEVESGISEKELYEIFNESRAPWVSDHEFDELWVQAISDLQKEPEITWRQVSIILGSNQSQRVSILTDNITTSTQLPKAEFASIGNSSCSTATDDFQGEEGYLRETTQPQEARFLRSTSKKYISLRCKFEREIYQTYYRFRLIIWGVGFLLILVKTVNYKLRKYYMEKEKMEQLTRRVVIRLKEAKKDSAGNDVISFLSTVQLRDVLLADITDLNYKNILWQKVVKRLEHNNTNIKTNLVEIHGEIMKCWEWIGPLSDSSDREK